MAPSSTYDQRSCIEITTSELSIMVGEGKKQRQALTGVSCSFGAAKLTALMGPSGAGKTTLLNALTGIGSIVKGKIAFNGGPRPNNFMAMCAVIPQEDTLYGALTPRETFSYVARLRLGDNVSREAKEVAVEVMLEKLGLQKCADTPVGNEDIRGISGGEKKRTSIGCELMVNPAVLFVDEPTSGLDSKMARSVVEHLQGLAHDENRTVITVIHQPSWRIFQLFDNLVLLADGRVVYDGSVSDVKGYFSNIGFPAPANENPMDFFFDILQEKEQSLTSMAPIECDLGQQTSLYKSGLPAVLPEEEVASGAVKETELVARLDSVKSSLPSSSFFSEKWLERCTGKEVTESSGGHQRGKEDADVVAAAEAAALAAARTSTLSQFLVLAERCCHDYVRDRTKLMGGIALKLSIGTLFGLIWLNQGRGKRTQSKIFTTEGPVFFCCFSAVFDTLFTFVIKYPLTRALIQREYRNRYYSIGPYFVAELLSRSTFECFNALLLATPTYFLVGLELRSFDQFMIFTGVLCILSVCGAGLGICVGTLAKDIQEAQGLVIPILMPLMLFSGFFLPYHDIPVYFRWLYEISFLRYAFNIVKMNQWQGVDFDDCKMNKTVCEVSCYTDGEEYLEDTNASSIDMPINFAILLSIMAVMITISFILMRRAIILKAKGK